MADFDETENLFLGFVPVQHKQMKQWIWQVGTRFAAVLILVLDKLCSPVFWILSWKPTKKIPAIDHEIYKISAGKLAWMIRHKKLTSEEIIQRYIQRIKKVNPIINAVVQDRFSEAVQDAKIVDKFLKETSASTEEIEKKYPLLGVPITIKESCKLKGMSFSVGINTRRGMIAEDDSEAVKRAKDAGAIPLLVSTTPEICFGLESDNYITGRCNNPYNTNHVCGGSSGGEGALLGAGCSIMGIGSDLAASIRLPALFNGVFGHKPTAHLVPNKDHYPNIDDEEFAKYLVVGPMARYAEDMRLLLKIIADKKIDFDEKIDLKDITVYFTEDLGHPFFVKSVSKEIKIALEKCVQHFKYDRKCKINNTKLIDLDKCFDMCLSLFFSVKNKPDFLRDQNDPSKKYSLFLELLMLPFNKSTFSFNCLGYELLIKSYSLFATENNDCFREMLKDLRAKLINTLGPNGIILLPTMPNPAFQHKTTIFNMTGVIYMMLFNILGFPATHVPMGLDQKGLPIGVQIVACPDRDVVCLSVAEDLDKKFGGWIPPPS